MIKYTTRQLHEARALANKPENRKKGESLQDATRRHLKAIVKGGSSTNEEISLQHYPNVDFSQSNSAVAKAIREQGESWADAQSRAAKYRRLFQEQ